MKWIPLFILSLLLFPDSGIAQSTIIEDLTARQLGDGVILRWKIGQGNSCIDMNIERGIDTADFQKLGEFRGLCGSNDSDTWYEWYDDTDLLPNTIYYYRIWASNGTVVSRPVQVDFRATETGILSLVPNPLSTSTSVYFVNPGGDKVSMHIFDMQGKELYRSATTVANQFTVYKNGTTGNLESGIYMIKVMAEGQVVACSRLFVQ